MQGKKNRRAGLKERDVLAEEAAEAEADGEGGEAGGAAALDEEELEARRCSSTPAARPGFVSIPAASRQRSWVTERKHKGVCLWLARARRCAQAKEERGEGGEEGGEEGKGCGTAPSLPLALLPRGAWRAQH